MDMEPEISLTVPGSSKYAIVIRTALGGVALLKDLSVDELDDLRMAADEACDCLLHQGRPAASLRLDVTGGTDALTVSLSAELGECDGEDCEDRVDISRAVLETLVPKVDFSTEPCGCISRIVLTMPRMV